MKHVSVGYSDVLKCEHFDLSKCRHVRVSQYINKVDLNCAHMTEVLTGTRYEPDEPHNIGATQFDLKAVLGFHHGVPFMLPMRVLRVVWVALCRGTTI